MNNKITDYFKNVLQPQLSDYGADITFINKLCDTVETQMYSALKHWNDIAFRNVLMLLVSEEAPFYRPDAPIEIKSFVVLTLRDSPFESLQSVNFKQTGLKKILTDSQVIKITSAAVDYFKDSDLLSFDESSCKPFDDIYFTLSQKYPVAWNALSALANSDKNSVTFTPIKGNYNINDIIDLKNKTSGEPTNGMSKKDGFDTTIEPALTTQLQEVLSLKIPFFSDCFKLISRNPDLVLQVLEFLFVNDLTFVSSNYLIRNGYAERRKNILKAVHLTSNDFSPVIKHCSNTNGISAEHRQILLRTREAYLSIKNNF